MKGLILLLLLMVGCSSKVVENTSKSTSTKPTTESRKQLMAGLEKIVQDSPSCTRYFWKNRGRAYKGYMNGMALMYAKQVCGKGSKFINQNRAKGKNTLGRNYEDAFAHYGISGNQLNTYTFLIGLGMRESNGKYCKGRDKSRNFKKADNAEAGIYQMAYVARVFNKELKPLYDKYKTGKLSCELEAFKDAGIKCNQYDSVTHGTGEGANWQQLMKRCPAASVQWASILVRSQYRHFGPIIRKEVEFKNECRDMLKKVEKLAKNNCSAL